MRPPAEEGVKGQRYAAFLPVLRLPASRGKWANRGASADNGIPPGAGTAAKAHLTSVDGARSVGPL